MTRQSSAWSAAAWLGCGAMALLSSACTSSSTPAPRASNESAATTPAPTQADARDPRETTIRLSAELMRECRFTADPSEMPRFDLDQATLHPRGRDVLLDLANCMTDGPLQHRTITVIGRADPRGTEAHNHELGANRAEAARSYLVARGVPEAKILVVSRGEESALGNEEASWALDRRVDLVLGDKTERSNISENPPANASADTPRANNAASYADQSEGSAQSGKVPGRSGPGTDSVPGK